MNDENRSQTAKVQALIRAMENLDTDISLNPQMPVLYPMQEVNTVPQQLPCPAPIAYGIRLEVSIVFVLHLLVLWRFKNR
ncbi:hypothetical protein [Oscillatoria acuminata]|uniref:Uncharacterized protein n=1 Tax=Oscillatoria acuminata PCC 6304 TaxID=56110 RepID=K9TDJ4_9CYAN|nr:hypothetical protein [Oscillatoria acuminata]AFY80605.1 hypothetical protein Oscil6304_0872 [Oscillatoria acuminata PCC 6304]